MIHQIVLIADPRVLNIPIEEIHEPLVEVNDIPNLVLGPQTNLMGPTHNKVRASVAERLIRADRYLPKGIHFYFEEGHRPLSVQKAIFEDYYQKLAAINPKWDNTKLRIEASKYVAPPDNTPPHSTGAAFDIGLIRSNGDRLEMGTLSTDTPDQNQNQNYTYAENISDIAKYNRQLLIDALSEAGFVNYPTEWWHWSYGDRYWAFCSKQPFAIYGSVEG